MNKTLVTGILLCFLLLVISLVGPTMSFVNIEDTDLYRNHDGVISTAPYPPSELNWLGTDSKGRDLLSLLIIGARNTLIIVFVITLIRYIIAIPLAIAASRGISFVHNLLHGWNQIFSGLPTLFAVILIIHLPVFYNSPNRTIWFILVIALIEIGRVGYLVQQNVSDLSKSMFVEAGRAVGNSTLGLYRRYYMPFLMPQLIVSFVLDLGRVLLLLGQLAFFSIFISQAWVLLDIGLWELQNTSIDWLSLIAESRHQIQKNPWLLLFPALAITITIVAFNFLGEGLRAYFENVTRRKYLAIKWLSRENVLGALKWLVNYRKPILLTAFILFLCIGTFRFYYTGFYGTTAERERHEQIVNSYLSTYYHPSAFTILETTYDFKVLPSYQTTFVYNVAPHMPFTLSYATHDYYGEYWIIYYEDMAGKQQEHGVLLTAPLSLPYQELTRIGAEDIIGYAKNRSELIAREQKAEEAIPASGQNWEENFHIPVAHYQQFAEKSELNNIFTSQLTGLVRLLDYMGIDVTNLDAPYNDPVYTVYTSPIDVIHTAWEQGVQIIPTYGDNQTIIEELDAGRPVLLMDRGYDGSLIATNRHRYAVMMIGYNEDFFLGYNLTEKKYVTYEKEWLNNRGILPHPILTTTYSNNNRSFFGGSTFVAPQVVNSQRPEGLELYLLAAGDEADAKKSLYSSKLYLKLLAIDTFYKGIENELFIELVEQNAIIEDVDYEYAYYHLFIAENAQKVGELIPTMLSQYDARVKEAFAGFVHPDADVFILFKELDYRYHVLTGNIAHAEATLEEIGEYLEAEYRSHPATLNRDIKRFMKLLHTETLFDLGKYYASQEKENFLKAVIEILNNRNIDDPRLDDLIAP